jgi:hypothetical protein
VIDVITCIFIALSPFIFICVMMSIMESFNQKPSGRQHEPEQPHWWD